ncbi:MAG: SRPBCC domain-containing protein [Bryobacteraceae bacterium]
MKYPESFRVSTPSDREILIERDFHAPRGRVFDAFTKPELVRRWLLGPDGWTMPVCDIDLRVGGKYRYVWKKESTGHEMGIGGTFLEVVRPERIVATEKFDDAWYPGEAINTTEFEERGRGITHVRLTMRYETQAARDSAARSGMEHGVAASYDRMEGLLSNSPIDPPAIIDTAPRLAAAIHLEIPRSQIRSAIGPALSEIMTAVNAQGIGPTGAWFDHHFAMHPDKFDFEICVPVSAPVAPTGRVVNREIPAIRVAQTTYHGPYEGLAAAWKDFDDCLREQGHDPGPDLFQCYATGPETTSDPSEWRTELRRPLRSKS